MESTEVLDLVSACISFPELPSTLLPRENFVQEIDNLFSDGHSVVVVTGDEGTGKTTLLALFSMSYPTHSISLFVRPQRRHSHDSQELLHDISNQLEVVLTGRELDPTQVPDARMLDNQLYRLRRMARNTTYYFVIDGLDELREEASSVLSDVLRSLPFSYRNLRFLFSGDISSELANLNLAHQRQIIRLTNFAPSETSEFFDGFDLDNGHLDEIQRTTKGRPSFLWNIRRSLERGSDIDNLLQHLSAELPDIFVVEWSKVDESSEHADLLALLAHSGEPLRTLQLSRIAGLSEAEVADYLSQFGFVKFTKENSEVAFTSESFRRYAAERLAHKQNSSISRLADDLIANPADLHSVTRLPSYLMQTAQYERLLAFLSERLPSAIDDIQSWNVIKRLALSGVKAAESLAFNAGRLQFATASSVLKELGDAHIQRDEIEARLALQDYEAAIAMAHSALLKEDRLQLLALIARAKRDHGLTPETELSEEIKRLYDELEPEHLGSRAIDIASDLIHSAPELAVDLVEKSLSQDVGENALDKAFVILSLSAMLGHDADPQRLWLSETVRDKISNPDARRLVSAASVTLGNYSGNQVIAESEKLDTASNQIFVLRAWCRANKTNSDAVEVIEHALKVIVETTEYAPNALVYRELAESLPFIEEPQRLRKLVCVLEAQIETVANQGPTEDIVRTHLLLARAESLLDIGAAQERLVEMYVFIHSLPDIVLQIRCFALLLATVARIDRDGIIDKRENLTLLVKNDLVSRVAKLFGGTAEHSRVMEGVVSALALTHPSLALELITKINTESRRDESLHVMVRALTESAHEIRDWKLVLNTLGGIRDVEILDETVDQVVKSIPKAMDHEAARPRHSDLMKLVDRVLELRDPASRCESLSRLLSVPNITFSDGLRQSLLEKLRDTWSIIDSGTRKVQTAFRVATLIADSNIEIAREFIKLSEHALENHYLGGMDTEKVHLSCMSLCLRALGGLIPYSLETPNDLQRLFDLIDLVPSFGVQAMITSDVAVLYLISDRKSDAERIVVDRVLPLIENIPTGDQSALDAAISFVAPAVYLVHPTLARGLIGRLPSSMQDEAYTNICRFILRKLPLQEPYDALPGSGSRLTYAEIIHLCDVIECFDSDSHIATFIEEIADATTTRKTELSLQQRPQVAQRIDEIINNKLPNPRFIQHEGYVILCRVHLARIRKDHNWQQLIDNAQAIPNGSDRAYVLAHIALALPKKQRVLARQLLSNAYELTVAIPAETERVERLEWLARIGARLDREYALNCLKVALVATARSSDEDVISSQRRIVDTAYRISPEFASSLASLFDEDPVRRKLKSRIEKQLDFSDYRRKIADPRADQESYGINIIDLPRAAWMNLAQLNADVIRATHADRLAPAFPIAAGMPLMESYPILSWAIQNSIKRHSTSAEAVRFLRPQFDALIEATEFSAKLMARLTGRLEQVKNYAVKSAGQSIIIHAGERDKALQFITSWFRENIDTYLKICDRYFGPDDMEVLKLVLSAKPDCRVSVLTSRKRQNDDNVEQPWSTTYRHAWHLESTQDPPPTEIVITGLKSTGELPIHDRWWITKGGGIRVGASLNGLGRKSDSEIALLTVEEAMNREEEIDRFLNGQNRLHKGERLVQDSFWL